jgi:hypothetical protein
MSTVEALLGRDSSGSRLESREYNRGDPLHWPHDILYPQKLALTSPKISGRSWTEATEFVVLFLFVCLLNTSQVEPLLLWRWGSKFSLTCYQTNVKCQTVTFFASVSFLEYSEHAVQLSPLVRSLENGPLYQLQMIYGEAERLVEREYFGKLVPVLLCPWKSPTFHITQPGTQPEMPCWEWHCQ